MHPSAHKLSLRKTEVSSKPTALSSNYLRELNPAAKPSHLGTAERFRATNQFPLESMLFLPQAELSGPPAALLRTLPPKAQLGNLLACLSPYRTAPQCSTPHGNGGSNHCLGEGQSLVTVTLRNEFD